MKRLNRCVRIVAIRATSASAARGAAQGLVGIGSQRLGLSLSLCLGDPALPVLLNLAGRDHLVRLDLVQSEAATGSVEELLGDIVCLQIPFRQRTAVGMVRAVSSVAIAIAIAAATAGISRG